MPKLSKFGSIKNNMMMYSLGIILLMALLSMYSLSIMERYKGEIQGMFEKHIYLSQVESRMNSLDADLLGFLTSKSSTRLNNYLIGVDQLQEDIGQVDEPIYNEEDLMMKNIVRLIEAYLNESNEAIGYKRLRNVEKYYEHYEYSVRIKGHIFDYIDQLNNMQLNRNSKSYLDLVNQIRLLQSITYIIVIILVLLAFTVVYYITARMVRPITHLSEAAEEIAKGNFQTDDVHVDSEDEFLLLAAAFNKMKNSISEYVDEMKKQAETEAKLKDEQLKNVKMEHLLDNARLYALQSQINPHFMFNTINAGVQLSILERAPKTGDFLETMSRLFRYNIQKMDTHCTLEEEINNIKDYYELLKVRFGKRIQFEFDIDLDAVHVKVPQLILQPLVENAYIHGLSGLEEGGQIRVEVHKKIEYVEILVQDTGVGMSKEKLEDIFSNNSGIGIKNVRDRLELFYHQQELFFIESALGKGVKITLKIPLNMEGVDV
ncbi:histidine kinase [Vallitaleaceae bacterium 9-2]